MDFFGRFLDAGEFFFIVSFRQVDPAEEVVAYAGLVMKLLVSELDRLCKIIDFVLRDESERFAVIEMNVFGHGEKPPLNLLLAMPLARPNIQNQHTGFQTQ